jgi:hypothetical protein
MAITRFCQQIYALNPDPENSLKAFSIYEALVKKEKPLVSVYLNNMRKSAEFSLCWLKNLLRGVNKSQFITSVLRSTDSEVLFSTAAGKLYTSARTKAPEARSSSIASKISVP